MYYISIYISNRPLYAHIILNIRWWCSSPRVGAILLLVSMTTVTTIYYVILLASVLARISPRHPPHPYLPPLLTPMLLIVPSPPFTTTDSQPPPLDVPPTSRRDPESATHQCTECLYYVSARCTPSSTTDLPPSEHLLVGVITNPASTASSKLLCEALGHAVVELSQDLHHARGHNLHFPPKHDG